MRQNPLRVHAETAQAFEQDGEAEAFRSWLTHHRSDLAAETRRAIVRHVGRMIASFGTTEVNSALFDLTTFERRLRLTVEREPDLPAYLARHWRRAIRHLVAAAYGMTTREATQLLERPRPTLSQARQANVEPIPLKQRQQSRSHHRPSAASSADTRDRDRAGIGTTNGPTLAQLVHATQTTWATLARVGDVEPEIPDQLIEAQLSCLSTQAKIRLLNDANLLGEPVRLDGVTSPRLVDVVDAKLMDVLRRRLALTTRPRAST